MEHRIDFLNIYCLNFWGKIHDRCKENIKIDLGEVHINFLTRIYYPRIKNIGFLANSLLKFKHMTACHDL